MGEPEEPPSYCEVCKAKMRKYVVAPFYCSLDGEVGAIAECFEKVMADQAEDFADG